ncbi:S-(hydroxymethyl)mycothiol dehydrogenase [uncultured Propionibacterium sp.]|uniref:S-(hydroxymethyl)mycothiol dehydrogenase n=1 Tax=uncultured Propionibacterium sp. TaxID=218066 RepID=UPI00292D9440|nr:S-(hydroxymethyl)mycothiol dehydrogenase [uncultured Propionibacterium sp.]
MSTTVQGVVSRVRGAPVELADVIVPDPGPGEVVVDITACGVCHTDLHYATGAITDDYPFLLGHEAAGTVSATGADVTHVHVGDHVVLNWRAICGQCRACRRGEPWYCFNTANAAQRMRLADGTELTAALGIGALAPRTLVAQGQCTKVDPAVRPQVAGLLGCGVMAGLGAALNTAAVRRGEQVAVIGLGGVGMAALLGARTAGATGLIAVDTDPRKLALAAELGATATIDATSTDVVAAVHELTGGFGADVVIDAVGTPATWKQAFYARDLAGRVVLVGVPVPEMQLDIPLIDVFDYGGSLESSWYGDCLPERDVPMLLDLYRQGRLDLDVFVSETIGIGQVNEAFEKMRTGQVLRSVVLM